MVNQGQLSIKTSNTDTEKDNKTFIPSGGPNKIKETLSKKEDNREPVKSFPFHFGGGRF